VAVRKSVLGNKGTVSLRLSDIFNTEGFRMYNYGNNFAINMERFRTSRMLYVGFSYRINEMERRNQRPREMNNDGGGMMDFGDF